ncbi:MAG TPA: holo-ACP synthase [Acidimicrobiales bacterium]|nr:holo-ACP synthase [Acidimicrobiales bacterium]
MTTTGIGIDLVDVDRFRRLVERRPRIVDRLFTEGERRDAHGRPERLAARFAAKEATLKTLGVGVGEAAWRSIEVTLNDVGAPSLVLHGRAGELARAQGVGYLHVSLSHTDHLAAAFVVGSSLEELGG